jgi:hypothetical protein
MVCQLVSVLIALAVAILSGTAGHAAELSSTDASDRIWQDRLLCDSDSSAQVVSVAVDENGTNVAFLEKHRGKERVVFEGQPGIDYERIDCLEFVDGLPTYRGFKRDRVCIVRGNQEGSAFGQIPYISYSPDHKSVAYWGVRRPNWDWYWVINDRTFGPFACSDHRDCDGATTIRWSADSKHVACEALVKPKNRCEPLAWVVLFEDGKTSHPYSRVNPIRFDRDGKLFYTARTSDRHSYSYVLIHGDQIVARSYLIDDVFFGSDERVGYRAEEDNGQTFIGWDGSIITPKGYIPNGPSYISTNETSFAYVEIANNKWYAVVDGKRSEPYARIEQIKFVPGTSDVVFLARVREDASECWSIVKGTETINSVVFRYPSFWFSPDGKTLAYIYSTGSKECVVINGKPQTLHDLVALLKVDNGLVAYTEWDGRKSRMVSNSYKSKWYDNLLPPYQFAPTGEPIFVASVDGKGQFLVVGETEIPAQVLTPIIFNAERNRIAFATRIGDQIWWKVLPVR